MRKLLLVISIMFVVLIFSSNAEALQAIDTQDATNWGDYFLPANTDPYAAPYYRWAIRTGVGRIQSTLLVLTL